MIRRLTTHRQSLEARISFFPFFFSFFLFFFFSKNCSAHCLNWDSVQSPKRKGKKNPESPVWYCTESELTKYYSVFPRSTW
ncbi:hypothetical protein RLOC_00001356 [Lonchura striata]|uniref:Uncharacterized protein n=1 Tax=Lonchura striata TaxID=40157 RepID=A0A218V7D5_9PASE|nr:hypothetical protein RLOC_00001356 [Lonchura striata domestica]